MSTLKPSKGGKMRTVQAEDNNNISVDDLLANVDQFIEGVYRDLSISPLPLRSAGSASSTPPDVASTSGATFRRESSHIKSPISRRNKDVEIEKINRICDNVEQNLRAVGVFMNEPFSTRVPEDALNRNLTTPPTSSTSIILLNDTSSTLSTIADIADSRNNSQESMLSPISEYVDLSNSEIETPEMIRQPVHHANCDGDNDDVILVSADIPPVINLCTPTNYQETHRFRPRISYGQLSRRRLSQQGLAETSSGDSSSTRKRRISYSSKNRKSLPTQLLPSENTEKTNISSPTNGDGRTPFMCPVCMESCLQRYPTSTSCGHVFCKLCISQAIAITRKCPLCNKKLTPKQTFRIYP